MGKKVDLPISLVVIGTLALSGISAFAANYLTSEALTHEWGVKEFRRVVMELSENDHMQLESFARSAVRAGYAATEDEAGVMYTVLERNLSEATTQNLPKGPLDQIELRFAVSEYALSSQSTFQLVSPYFLQTFSEPQDLITLQYLNEALECAAKKNKGSTAQEVGFKLGQQSWNDDAATFLGTYVAFCRSE